MAALEVVALNTTVPQLMAPQAGDTYSMPRALAVLTVAIGGATIGTDALAVTGSATLSSNVVSGGYFLLSGNTGSLNFRNGNTVLVSPATATIQLGAFDAVAPVAQTLQAQSVVAGTSNTAGADWSFYGSKSTGTGAGGSLKFYTSPAGSTGTAQNAGVLGLTLDSTGALITGSNITIATGAQVTFNGRGSLNFTSAGVLRVADSTVTNTFTMTPGASNLATFNGPITSVGTTGSGYISSTGLGFIGRGLFSATVDGTYRLATQSGLITTDIAISGASTTGGSLLTFGGAVSATGFAATAGNVTSTGAIVSTASFLRAIPVTVASLPAASGANTGARLFVTDALGPVFGSAVVGGGAIPVPVYSDGTTWKVG